jgi:demethylmenaquinone methyltransferase/2-methoxy-6-polyprenyl-1,4-benzoquinol methylase
MVDAIKDKSKQTTWQLFDRIADRYDLLNRILSGGIDVYWRRKMISFLPQRDQLILLDLATGTGDVMLMLAKKKPHLFSKLIGMDLSQKMMSVGKRKSKRDQLDSLITFQRGDATAIPMESCGVDVVTISFGIRNVADVSQALSEMYRVLKFGGVAMILEFSIPENSILKQLYLFYFRYVLPKVGALISGDAVAYTYLNQSVESFPYGDAFGKLMCAAGFKNNRQQPLTGGIATLYVGVKL